MIAIINQLKEKETQQQKHIIEEKQKEILDSIYYAKRIQTALITSEKYIERNLNELNTNLHNIIDQVKVFYTNM